MVKEAVRRVKKPDQTAQTTAPARMDSDTKELAAELRRAYNLAAAALGEERGFDGEKLGVKSGVNPKVAREALSDAYAAESLIKGGISIVSLPENLDGVKGLKNISANGDTSERMLLVDTAANIKLKIS